MNDVGVSLRDVVTSYNATLRHATLHIRNLNRSDQLNYFCTVANTLGYNNLTIFVRVKGTQDTQRIRGILHITVATPTSIVHSKLDNCYCSLQRKL